MTETSIDRIIRPRALADRLGVSVVSLWRWRRNGDLPEPIRISAGTVGWREAEIVAWLDRRAGTSGSRSAA